MNVWNVDAGTRDLRPLPWIKIGRKLEPVKVQKSNWRHFTRLDIPKKRYSERFDITPPLVAPSSETCRWPPGFEEVLVALHGLPVLKACFFCRLLKEVPKNMWLKRMGTRKSDNLHNCPKPNWVSWPSTDRLWCPDTMHKILPYLQHLYPCYEGVKDGEAN